MLKERRLGNSGMLVSAIGLGCMGMSEGYGPSHDPTSRETLERAHELGVTFLDTADTYGDGHNERFLGGFLREHPRVKVATKFGMIRGAAGSIVGVDNSPDYIVQACEASLKRLRVETIDLYYAHRIERGRPIEETVESMAGLVRAGKVRSLGLCEVSESTLRRAHAVHPIAAVQSEYSLWTRDPERSILRACRELDIAFVAYSPLGRGMLTGTIGHETRFADNDFRRIAPRFQGENFDCNLRLVETLSRLALQRQCTPGQLALAWLLAQGTQIIPIPGTRRAVYLEENVKSAEIVLSDANLAAIQSALPSGSVAGARYPEAAMTRLDG